MDQDTSPEASRRYHELLRAMTPGERMLRAASLSQTVRLLALAGLRQRHPLADEDELRRRLVVRLYGREYAQKVLGEIPADAI